ncbi:MAG: hypothetical protein AAFW67_14060, partial [Cyanobacteria bacterium J06638_38]
DRSRLDDQRIAHYKKKLDEKFNQLFPIYLVPGCEYLVPGSIPVTEWVVGLITKYTQNVIP